ncbi:response regulator [Chryseobacterium sp. S90]|uniref:response regulator n=1 Tax=Chryseobacterium sp. S90 TaxID=3395373 RepID=UPI0039BC7E60
MNSIYFLPYSGVQKIDEFNDKLKENLLNITNVVPVYLRKLSDYFPENCMICPDLVFIPSILDSSNPMSYDGIDLAIRWYIHAISLNKTNFRLVILGIEDKASFYQHCNYSNLLKCPNVDYIQNSFEYIKKIIDENILKEFDRNEALEKIDLIGIKPPTSYKSHHSISNEWSILRWAKALNIQAEFNNELEKNESNINASLFYKYLSIKYPMSPIGPLNIKVLKNNGTILLIDDEVEKGWGCIFQRICTNKNFSFIGVDFKKIKERDEIVERAFQSAIDAEVIILDLRLHDDDFDERDPKKLTGYALLKKIKNHNKGIQVIIFSASNKVWNLQELQEVGIDGFILKESPENSIDQEFTKHLIENIYQTIDNCLAYSFLKKNFEKYNFLKQQLEPRRNRKELPKAFVNEYLKWLEFGISNILKYKSNEGNIMSFLIFFTVLENIANRVIDVDNPINTSVYNEYKYEYRRDNKFLKYYTLVPHSGLYIDSGKDLIAIGKINWTQKVINTLAELSCNLTDITSLINKRNDIIHSNSTTGNSINISEDELKHIFDIITSDIENIQ